MVLGSLCGLGITLASRSVDGKNNEIPAVQELLEELDISGCMIVADALNCQKETAKAVISGIGDYLELLHHARMEWAAETMHWLLDVHFGEDFCRAADKTIQKNLNILRKFALSIFKTFKQKTASKRLLSHIMFAGLLNPASLRALLFEN